MCMHVSSLLVATYVPCTPPTHCDNLFFVFHLFYRSRLAQLAF